MHVFAICGLLVVSLLLSGAKTMFTLVHRFTGKALLRFLTLEEALVALQDAAVPDLFYISNHAGG
jgi:hypothetical protein